MLGVHRGGRNHGGGLAEVCLWSYRVLVLITRDVHHTEKEYVAVLMHTMNERYSVIEKEYIWSAFCPGPATVGLAKGVAQNHVAKLVLTQLYPLGFKKVYP